MKEREEKRDSFYRIESKKVAKNYSYSIDTFFELVRKDRVKLESFKLELER